MALPPLTPEQRKAALEKAAASRRERAEVKNRLKNAGASISEVLAEGQQQRGDRQDAGHRPAAVDAGPRQGPRPADHGAARHRREPPGPRARDQAGRGARDASSAAGELTASTPPSRPCSPARPRSARAASRPTSASTTPRSGSRCPRPPARRGPGEVERRPLLVRLRRGVRPDGRRRTTLLEWAVVHGAAALRHPAAAASTWRWPPGGPRCWRSTSRAPGRCGRRCRRRCSCSWRHRRGRSWSAAWSAGAPRTRPSGSAGWPPRARSWPPQAEFDVSIVNREVHAAAEELVALMDGSDAVTLV